MQAWGKNHLKFSIRITAELIHLAVIRAFVRESVPPIDAPILDDLLLAVNEAVTNIIVHGYRGKAGEIELSMEVMDDALVLRLRDQAPLFNPTTVASPNLAIPIEQRQLGGMGIHLMRSAVDDLIYQVTPTGGNELILVKKRTQKE